MDIKELWQKYYNALKQQDWTKALSALNSINEKKPRNSQVHLKMGDLMQRMGNTAGAIESYHRAAVYLVKEGFIQKAAAIFKIILRLDPKNTEAAIKLEKVFEVAASAKTAFLPFAASAAETQQDISETPSYIEPVAPAEEAPKQAEIHSFGEIPFPDIETGPSVEPPKQAEIHSFGEMPFPDTEPGPSVEPPKQAEIPSYGEIPFPDTEPGPSTEKELGPGYGEITLDDEEIEATEQEIIEPLVKGPQIEKEEAEIPFNDIAPGPSEEKVLAPGYGEISLDDEEIEATEKKIMESIFKGPKPEEEIQEKQKVKVVYGFEDFDDLLAEVAKDLPFAEERSQTQADLPVFLMPLGENLAREFLRKAVTTTYRAGQRIISEGDAGDSLFFIRKGSAKVVAHILGKEFVLATLGSGDIFGEVTFLTGRPRTASVVAEADNEVLEFDRQLIEEAISKNPEVLECLNDLYDTRVQSTIKKIVGD